ncbi:MAG: PilZ domain-containing protein [Thermoanaerobaculia bacterium]
MDGTRPSDEGSAFWNEAVAGHPEAVGGGRKDERRANGRLVPPAPIAARVRGLHFARILDISRRGALAESAELVRPLERNELLIHFPDGPFVTQATVQRCRAWRQSIDPKGERILFFRSGFEFDSLSREELEALERNLCILQAEARAVRHALPPSAAERAWRLAGERRPKDG